MEAFERALKVYQDKSREVVSDNIRVGIVLNQLAKSTDAYNKLLAEHLVLNASRLDTWTKFRDEIIDISRSRIAASGGFTGLAAHPTPNSGVVPMDVGAVHAKGGGKQGAGGRGGAANSQRTCFKCGKAGHIARECRSSGAAPASQQSQQRPTGGGRGSSRPTSGSSQSSASKDKQKCNRCGKPGHYARDCRAPKPVHGVSEGEATVGSPEKSEPDEEKTVGGLWISGIDVDICPLCTLDDDSLEGVKSVLYRECDQVDGDLIAAVDEEKRKIRFGVDSGAAITVITPEAASDYPRTTGDALKLRDCQGVRIQDMGKKILGLRHKGGRLRFAKTTVASVKKNLMAVAALVDAGHDVMFSNRKGNYFENCESGDRTPIERVGDTYELEFDLEPFADMPPAPARGNFRP